MESGEISQEEYDDWKYNYPSKDTYKNYVKVPSEGLMNFLFESEDDK